MLNISFILILLHNENSVTRAQKFYQNEGRSDLVAWICAETAILEYTRRMSDLNFYIFLKQ